MSSFQNWSSAFVTVSGYFWDFEGVCDPAGNEREGESGGTIKAFCRVLKDADARLRPVFADRVSYGEEWDFLSFDSRFRFGRFLWLVGFWP